MKGFTLVELMVAMFIFALLAMAGVSLLSTSLTGQAQVNARNDRLAAFQRTRAILRADLGQAAPRLTREETGAARPAFSGGTEGSLFSLVRRGWENVDGRPRASLQYVEYRLQEDRLERRTRPMVDGARLGEPVVLISGVRSLALHFLRDGEWRESWDPATPDALPEAVSVAMRLDGLGDIEQYFLVPAGG